MRNIWILLVMIGVCSCGKQGAEVHPTLQAVTVSSAVVAWESPDESIGGVEFWKAGSTTIMTAQDTVASLNHEVILDGLEPGTRYAYRIKGFDSRFNFRTEPLPETPISLLVIASNDKTVINSLVMAAMPDLIINLAPLSPNDPFALVKPLVPVQAPAKKHMSWAGVSFIFTSAETPRADLNHTLMIPGQYAFGIIALDPLSSAQIDAVEKHNAANPKRPVVCVITQVDQPAIAGVKQVRLPESATGCRLDLSPESMRAVLLPSTGESLIREPKLQEKRTCVECRKLADKGSYEESVKAYKLFIEQNSGHYQIDDAYFAIATIYDDKLFQFPEALTWYKRLKETFPTSSLTPLATVRIEYLTRYPDHDYKPLQVFERIRKIDYARSSEPADREALLKKVLETIKTFPSCELAPVMLYWVANQYRRITPGTAVDLYQRLKRDYPKYPRAAEALIEIGETLYDAELYHESRAAYEAALAELPDRTDVIQPQIARCNRNIRRYNLMLGSGIIFIITVLIICLIPPIGLPIRTLGLSLLTWLTLSGVLAGGGWLIVEQFESPMRLVAFAGGFAASAACSFPLAGKASNLFRSNRVAGMLARIIVSLIIFSAGLYLTIYSVNSHYLVIIKL